MAGGARSAIGFTQSLPIGENTAGRVDAIQLTVGLGRYILSMAVADCSGQAWLQGFNDAGTMVFGVTADELMELKVRVASSPAYRS